MRDTTSYARAAGIPCDYAHEDAGAVAQTGTRVVVARSRWFPWRKKTTVEPVIENYFQRDMTLLTFVRGDLHVHVPVVNKLLSEQGIGKTMAFIAPHVNHYFEKAAR